MGSSRDEYDKLRAQQQAAQAARRASRAASQAQPKNPTKPGAPTVETPTPGTDLKAAVQPAGTAAVAPVAPVADIWGPPVPGQGITPSIVADATAWNQGIFEAATGSEPAQPKPIVAEPKPVMTPYGPISTTNLQGQKRLERAVNPLAQERPLNPVQQAAQNYRDLAGSPAGAFAKQQYANALSEKSAGLRAERAGRENPRLTEEQKIAHYNEYLLKRKGIDPYDIGGAQLTQREGGGHGLNVLSPEQETAARSTVNEAAKRSREMMNAERILRRFKTPEGILASQEQRSKRIAYEIEMGLRNPMNPTAGMDTTNAMRVQGANELAKVNSSTLKSLAKREKKIEEQKQEPVEESQSKLDLAGEREREEQKRFAEELRRRRAAIMGKYAYNS